MLTDKQRKFCEEDLIDLNGTQAAIRAGYSEISARQIAEENMSKPDIKEFIKLKQSELSIAAKIDATWVLNRLLAISNRCMQANPKLVKMGKEWVHAEDEDGNLLFTFDSMGATKSAELIGKHIGFFEVDNKQKTQIEPVTIQILPLDEK